jgi:spermidine/putrescine transport system permease protein
VSENVRLYGWVLFFINGGVLDGALQAAFGAEGPDILFRPAAILFGMVYVYLPFMLFPMVLGLSSVPDDLREAAADLGASRWQVWRTVELPLATSGIAIGMLLTFVLAAGAVAEAKILGGQSVIVATHDIEIAFTYAQNWPLGAALAVLMMLMIGAMTAIGIGRVDLDRIVGRR